MCGGGETRRVAAEKVETGMERANQGIFRGFHDFSMIFNFPEYSVPAQSNSPYYLRLALLRTIQQPHPAP